MKNKQKITYEQVGDNYETKDPIKKLAQDAAAATGKNLTQHGFEEVKETRGESAFVWKQNNVFMASVVEGLGTKNLIADEMRKIADLFELEPQSRKPERSRRTYYDVIGHDTVATVINDLISVGATPLVIHAYWAIEDNEWLQDKQRMIDLITGWKSACDISGATWGGGETATMKQIVVKDTAEFAGSAVGIISAEQNLITDKKLRSGDRILLCRSTGINANGLSLARAVAKKLPDGYGTKMEDGQLYGEAILQKTNIYAKVIHNLLADGVDVHYISNITGHGLRKVMRARGNFTYIIEQIIEPQEVFRFIQNHANLDDYTMYQTYNMGMDYAIFLPQSDVAKAQEIVTKSGFESINAGYIEEGPRQVIIKPKNITFKGDTLNLR